MFPATKSSVHKCPKCDQTSFELAKLKLDNTNFMPVVIICKACGAVIGTVSAAEFLEYQKNFPELF